MWCSSCHSNVYFIHLREQPVYSFVSAVCLNNQQQKRVERTDNENRGLLGMASVFREQCKGSWGSLNIFRLPFTHKDNVHCWNVFAEQPVFWPSPTCYLPQRQRIDLPVKIYLLLCTQTFTKVQKRNTRYTSLVAYCGRYQLKPFQLF